MQIETKFLDTTQFLDVTNTLLANAPDRKAWKQILAQHSVYVFSKDQIGKPVPQPKSFLKSSYIIEDVIEDGNGFKAVVLVPSDQKNKKAKPIIIFQGTVWGVEPFLDDLTHTIGSRSFERNKEAIEKILSGLQKRFGKVVVMGHSLGGCIAQLTSLFFRILIDKCRLYNSPGTKHSCDSKDIKSEDFDENMKQWKCCEHPVKVVHVRHIGDWISLAGGDHLPFSKLYTMGTYYPGRIWKSHSDLTLSDTKLNKVITKDPQIGTRYQSVVETLRWCAKVVPHAYDWFYKPKSLSNRVNWLSEIPLD